MKRSLIASMLLVAGLAVVGCEEKAAAPKVDAGTKAVTDAVKSGTDAVKDAAKTGTDAAKDAVKTGTDAAKGAVDAAKAGAADATKAATDAMAKMKETALAEAPKMLDTAQAQLTSLKEKVAKLPDAVKPVATTALGEIEKNFNSLKEQAGGLKGLDVASIEKTWKEWTGKLTGLNDSMKKFTEQFKL